ncbi:MAG: DUF5615 family PIN-like protein [Fimbriimonadia bacterium]|nr:DUF5615 family PIN-like protein [Fimbriimonadia bacterium]
MDENVYPDITKLLRDLGHDAVDVKQAKLLGASDEQVFSWSQEQKRTIITFDRHFADIIMYPPSSHHGIILLRFHPPLLSEILDALQALLADFMGSQFSGRLIILSSAGYRVRSSP